MSSAFGTYRRLQEKLLWIRWMHLGLESADEDALLEEMDGVWWNLTADERKSISAEPPRADPIQDKQNVPGLVDVDVKEHPGPVRWAAKRRIVYITAHRVTACGSGATGINCFLHRHDDRLGVDVSWSNEAVDRITYHNPGHLIEQVTNLPPGGRRRHAVFCHRAGPQGLCVAHRH